jgi:GNAT superfamily N-acetyltransferase
MGSRSDHSSAVVKVRSARPADADGICELLGQLGYERTSGAVLNAIQSAMADPQTAVLVAAIPDGRLVGCLQAVVTRRLAEGDCGEIASLVVDRSRRSQGIGERLTRAAAAWLRDRNVIRLRVRCNVERTRAHQFYERIGFKETKTQKVFDAALTGLVERPS